MYLCMYNHIHIYRYSYTQIRTYIDMYISVKVEHVYSPYEVKNVGRIHIS
jgi:hypothetical protein